MVIHFEFLAKIVDVDTAFKEEIYMECPQYFSDMGKDDCIILNKCIYGLVQAARQYYKKATKILKKSLFIGVNVNPYYYIEKKQNGNCLCSFIC